MQSFLLDMPSAQININNSITERTMAIMYIDNSIIINFLNDNDDYKNHWLFTHILPDRTFTFSQPKQIDKKDISVLYHTMIEHLHNFTPYNHSIIEKLFPNWKTMLSSLNVILAIGCPPPYDAMTRTYQEKEYIIFDLVRFLDYQKQGYDIFSIIMTMITHEFIHICIHNDYPCTSNHYVDKLKYIVFDEGFAHLLSFQNNIFQYDFASVKEKYYHSSLIQLQQALLETSPAAQSQYLESSNTGNYWDKFGAISGKLYLSDHLKQLHHIYRAGVDDMLQNMLHNI